MKYSKYIVFLLSINLIIVFLSIFIGNLTRKIELNNYKLMKNIKNEEDQLVINQVEFSLYNNVNYLKKLHKIYFSINESYPPNKIISFSSISNNKTNNLRLVKFKLKNSDK